MPMPTTCSCSQHEVQLQPQLLSIRRPLQEHIPGQDCIDEVSYDLKELIKEKTHAFRDLDASALQLWKVDLLVDNTLEHPSHVSNLKLDHKKELSPVDQMVEVFDTPPHRKHLHIVVQPLPARDHPGNIFPVKIALTDTVGNLKELIKENKPAFRDLDADTLRLWKVDLPVDDTLESNIDNLKPDHKKALSPVDPMFEVFDTPPQRKHLHIVVQPPLHGSRNHLQPLPSALLYKQFCGKYSQEPPPIYGQPSEFKGIQKNPDQFVHWDRPPENAHTIPCTLLHPIFGTFMDDCENIEPTPDDNKLAMTLSVVMSGFFTDEKARAYKFREVLQEHGINITATTISGTVYVTDGDIQYKGFRYAIAKVKNEPSLHLGLQYFTTRDALITTSTGPHIDFSAAVWSTRPNMQVVSTALPLFHHPTDSKMRAMVARHIGALRKALRSLLACYQGITSPSPDQDLEFLDSKFQDLMFPYPYSFTCIETSLTCDFTYYHQMDHSRLPFSAVKTTDDKTLCIKFVRRYSKEVHQRCASDGFAPALLGFEQLPGGWYMIVMEMITDDYCRLQDITVPYPHHDALATELQSLHRGGYVHGDVRDTNIMVKKDCSPGFMLVDFDWSGAIGEARYPMNVY
ncbi:uncharacterized protein HD556DRAFT_1527757 [Suillus plorans]|uniref:Crinkler effector protein N-terminal domain-containing protein n=1 Tax=Suillus plorans TaxID=116603 RepID=A0A9P7AN59_9AGAM|nr:uncharacterized protein HD556DRAFT_1527757 [Suillus plorans]KAG1792983.1 hypothetical protein HD556DRAFT_1527757 [Suillus plorans]